MLLTLLGRVTCGVCGKAERIHDSSRAVSTPRLRLDSGLARTMSGHDLQPWQRKTPGAVQPRRYTARSGQTAGLYHKDVEAAVAWLQRAELGRQPAPRDDRHLVWRHSDNPHGGEGPGDPGLFSVRAGGAELESGAGR
jgi:hypothetical protein